ncbi:hypothetical protein [Bradyrhizobium diazoefficiens]|uniref:Methyltransferase FkbM domain-containing protein n=1 Tax=Bradyrhizobium diazoefficiens TaxID=1355477 RepID=A0A809YGI4_9BRAD|nr:hypothetical protein [Bradyrhizobium diazoefficiens]BCA04210.1 hypothetical protein H12S4_51140 [Bradyrhizobium diazoefficiens]BCA21567.1 hypothetical protein BDHH15_47820 [Bradyrhizobium diazoefficiens]BCE39736.1 hypothetical protein XF3B_47670 [Bradyrhizobium diazoefficiens]BCF53132.1 hypothetical protein XF17B_47700 [Bradyrhizobium diazoefficiens]
MGKTLFDYRDAGYSQSGEEGILLRIMEILGKATGVCCEFGAWDGIHLSNTRRLMENGWRGLMIEADETRFNDLLKTYPEGSAAKSVCALVDDGDNSLANIAARSGTSERLDLVSIDIDGLDFEVFATLDQFPQPPLVVIVEVHTCHKPDDTKPVPREIALQGCGQPLGLFIEQGRKMGYRLVSFVGTNAIFVHRDAGHDSELPTMTGEQVALQNLPVIKANKFAREYLFLVNRGQQQPGYRFDNPLFSWRSLGIGPWRAWLLASGRATP